jgi:hypothetical protein
LNAANGFADDAAQPVLMQLKTLFAAHADARPNARDWVVRAAKAVPGWLASPKIDPELALQTLALLALREHQMALPDATATAAELSRLLGQNDSVSSTTATLAMAVAEEAGAPIDLSVAKRLAGKRLIGPSQLAGLVRRIGASEGVAAAVSFGQSALQYTENDELLQELETLARQSGDADRAASLEAVRAKAAAARAVLDGQKPAADIRNLTAAR